MRSAARFLVGLVLVLACVAAVARAQNSRPATLAGVPRFDADATWPKTPADWSWGQVIGIFADEQGHVWTSSRSRIQE